MTLFSAFNQGTWSAKASNLQNIPREFQPFWVVYDHGVVVKGPFYAVEDAHAAARSYYSVESWSEIVKHVKHYKRPVRLNYGWGTR